MLGYAQRATDRDLEGVFLRMLGYVLHRQPTVVLRVSSSREVNAWICAQRATDRDLEGVFLRMLGYVHSGQPTVISRVSSSREK